MKPLLVASEIRTYLKFSNQDTSSGREIPHCVPELHMTLCTSPQFCPTVIVLVTLCLVLSFVLLPNIYTRAGALCGKVVLTWPIRDSMGCVFY